MTNRTHQFSVVSVFEDLPYDWLYYNKHSRQTLVVRSFLNLTEILNKSLQEDFSAGRCLVEALTRGPKNLQVYYQQYMPILVYLF